MIEKLMLKASNNSKSKFDAQADQMNHTFDAKQQKDKKTIC